MWHLICLNAPIDTHKTNKFLSFVCTQMSASVWKVMGGHVFPLHRELMRIFSPTRLMSSFSPNPFCYETLLFLFPRRDFRRKWWRETFTPGSSWLPWKHRSAPLSAVFFVGDWAHSLLLRLIWPLHLLPHRGKTSPGGSLSVGLTLWDSPSAPTRCRVSDSHLCSLYLTRKAICQEDECVNV